MKKHFHVHQTIGPGGIIEIYVEKAGGRVARTTGGSIHWWLFIMNQIPRQYEFVCEAARLFVLLGKNDTSILMKPTF